MATVLGYLRELCTWYEEHKSPTTTKTETQIEEVDTSSLDEGDTNVSEINKDKAIDFRTLEFRQVDWREALCYGTQEEIGALSKTVTLPPPSLQGFLHQGRGGCTSECVRGTVGTEKSENSGRIGDVKCAATRRQPGGERTIEELIKSGQVSSHER